LFIYLFYFTKNNDGPEPAMPSADTSSNTKIWWQNVNKYCKCTERSYINE